MLEWMNKEMLHTILLCDIDRASKYLLEAQSCHDHPRLNFM